MRSEEIEQAAVDYEKYYRPFYGYIVLATGEWHSNDRLTMSAQEQYDWNKANGFDITPAKDSGVNAYTTIQSITRLMLADFHRVLKRNQRYHAIEEIKRQPFY